MRQETKLKLVFDFIADYLSDDDSPNEIVSTTELTTKELITEADVVETGEDDFTRAYEIMKRLEVSDNKKLVKVNADTIKMLRDENRHLRNENDALKAAERKKIDETGEKLGLTIGPDGKVVSVSVKPLTHERGEIEKHISAIKESN